MQAMNITIQIDETQFKDILDKELKDMPKEQLQEIIKQAFTQFFITNPKAAQEMFFTENEYGFSKRKEPTQLLKSIINNISFEEECDEILTVLKDEFKGNAREIIESIMIKAMAKVFFDKSQGEGWLEMAFDEMHYKYKQQESNN